MLNCLTTDAQRTTLILIQSGTDKTKKHLVSNNFCAAIFVLLSLYFKSRGQISRVTCAVVTRLPASRKLIPSTLNKADEQVLEPAMPIGIMGSNRLVLLR